MLRLVEADKMTAPIWESGLHKTDPQLIVYLQEIKDLVPEGGYRLRNPLGIIALEVLSDDLEQAFLKLIQRYEKITGEDLQRLKHLEYSD